MTLLGLDQKAWVLVGAFLLVLIGGTVLGLLMARTDARAKALRRENRRLARALGRSNATNARLRAQLHAAQRHSYGDLTAVLDAVQTTSVNGREVRR